MSGLNDPRVFFAAERTLLSWNRTSLALMAFGFMIERSGLLLTIYGPELSGPLHRSLSFWLGTAFIVLGGVTAGLAAAQHRTVLKTLRPVEIPRGYRPSFGVAMNLVVMLLGLLLAFELFWNAPR
jgi:putative membrane protein